MTRFMFRLTENSKLILEQLTKKLLKIAYRLIICWENKHKDGSEANPHYHGYIEMDGNKTRRQNYDKLNGILVQHCEIKQQRATDTITPEDEKAVMSYVTKQNNIVCEYNTSYTPDDLAEWWKEESKKRKEENEKKKQLLKDKICQQYMDEITCKQNIPEIKVWVARKLIDQELLPVMGKVRAYTMYIVHKCGLQHLLVEELDKLL